MMNWYLIYTKPRSEDDITKKITNRGLEVFNTKLKERRFIRRKLQDVVSPLFPCYVFARFDNLTDYTLIKYTRGVKKVVGIDNAPTIVSEEIITSIRNRIENGVVAVKPQFHPGEGVLVKAGPFEGLDAIFEKELKGLERVSILLKTINARLVVDSAILSKN